MKKLLNKCPICGSKLETDSLWQYSVVATIKKDGTTSKRYRICNKGPMECTAIRCINNDFATDYDLIVETPKNSNILIFSEGSEFFFDDEADGLYSF